MNAGDWNDDLQENGGGGQAGVLLLQDKRAPGLPSVLFPPPPLNNGPVQWPAGRALPQAYLGFLEQHRGVETGVGVGDVQPTVVGHFLLQGADVRWRWTRNKALPLQPAPAQKRQKSLRCVAAYRVSSLRSWECLETTGGMSCCAL